MKCPFVRPTIGVATLLALSACSAEIPDTEEPEFGAAAVTLTLTINELLLVNTSTNTTIMTLTDGAVLDLAKLPTRSVSVVAVPAGVPGGIAFALDGSTVQIENYSPYAIAGDTNGRPNPWSAPLGAHTLAVTPYTEAHASGTAGVTKSIRFTVLDSGTTEATVVADPDAPPPTMPPPGYLAPGASTTTGLTATNAAPAVTITAPVNGATKAAPGYYVLRANASDADGRVVKVEFFVNGQLAGSAEDVPFSASWRDAAPGTYVIVAKATDDEGATRSTAVGVTIVGPITDQTFYVSSSGNDANPGSSAAPFRTISRAVQVVGPGDRVVIRPGTYRESITISKSGTATAPITFQAETPGTVIITGADPVTGWTKDVAKGFYSAPWSYDFYYNGNRTNGGTDGKAYAEQFVYNGVVLVRELTYANLGPGEFYIDYNANRVSVRLPGDADPRGGSMLGSTRTRLLWSAGYGNGQFISLSGLTFRYAANFAQQPAVKTDSGWRISNCTFEYMSSVGLGVAGSDVYVEESTVQYNGQLGFHGSSTNALLADNATRYNNTKGFKAAYEAGGGKLTRTDGLYVLRLRAYGNRAQGFWLDVYNQNYTFDGGSYHDNKGVTYAWEGMGLMLEINQGPGRVVNAQFYNNTGAGLSIAESPFIVARGNVFVNDDVEIRNMANRPYSVHDIGILGNYFQGAVIRNSLGTWSTTSFQTLRISGDYNKFDPGGSLYYWAKVSYTDLTSVRTILKQEAHGSIGVQTVTLQ